MRTTLDLPDPLMREVKVRAAQQDRKLKEVVEELIRTGLRETRSGSIPPVSAAPKSTPAVASTPRKPRRSVKSPTKPRAPVPQTPPTPVVDESVIDSSFPL